MMKKELLIIFLIFFSIVSPAQNISLEPIGQGFDRPLNIQNAGDERLFIVEQGGKINIIQPDGDLSPTPFIDISSKISTGGERGLLGLAFHPDFQNNGFFFLNYTNQAGDTHISRFSVNSGNPDLADPDSELLILSYTQPAANHNGGDILFGPEGYLYISSGDGGQSGDPANNAQNLNEFLGKILRIDVDHPDGQQPYSIPVDNPFVNIPNVKEEIWAYGLRNPWRFTIDEVDGNIWIADVGQASLEEINKQPLSAGGINYGWRCYEGTQPFNTSNCPAASELTFPIAEYSHTEGCSITGGKVYRGNQYPTMTGFYFFADYCSGIIGTVSPDETLNILSNFDGNWVSFGEDVYKELYIADINGGAIYKIVETSAGTSDLNPHQFQVFPNPTSDIVSINTTIEIQAAELFDTSGRLIKSITFKKPLLKNSFDFSALEEGIYLLQIRTVEGNFITKKIIKQ